MGPIPKPIFDDVTADHFFAWLGKIVHEKDRDRVAMAMVDLLIQHPDLVNTHSWTEIRTLTGA